MDHHCQQNMMMLYHQKHFDNFSDEQKQKLIEHHGKAIEIIKVQ